MRAQALGDRVRVPDRNRRALARRHDRLLRVVDDADERVDLVARIAGQKRRRQFDDLLEAGCRPRRRRQVEPSQRLQPLLPQRRRRTQVGVLLVRPRLLRQVLVRDPARDATAGMQRARLLRDPIGRELAVAIAVSLSSMPTP